MTQLRLRKRILIPFIAAVLLLVVTGIVGMQMLLNSQIHNQAHNTVVNLANLYDLAVENDAQDFARLLDQIAKNERYARLKLQGNRSALYTEISELYKLLNKNHRVTHLYFHNPDRSVFLRAHKPNLFGDIIDRQTLMKTVETADISHGLELGVFGSFVLRVVYPWYFKNQLIGYIELGEEIDYITPMLSNALEVDLFVLLNKQNINRTDWEKFYSQTPGLPAWENFPNHIVNYQSISEIPSAIVKKFMKAGSIIHNELYEFEVNNRHYHAINLPLKDIRNQEIGELVTVLDSTQADSQLQKASYMLFL